MAIHIVVSDDEAVKIIQALLSMNHSHHLRDYNRWMHGTTGTGKMQLVHAHAYLPKILVLFQKHSTEEFLAGAGI
jgi:hypothetical protein